MANNAFIVTIDDTEVRAALGQLMALLAHLTPVIGLAALSQ
jgi:hypothetical protein